MTSTTKDEPRRTLAHGGCSLSYVVRGDGIPTVFIQGVGVQGDGWLPQVDVLRGEARCLTFDNRGLGRSQPVGAGVTVARMADDALALMRAVGWESAHLVGHSLGGPVAIEIALTARERVRSLSLLCTFARGRARAARSDRGPRSRPASGSRGAREAWASHRTRAPLRAASSRSAAGLRGRGRRACRDAPRLHRRLRPQGRPAA